MLAREPHEDNRRSWNAATHGSRSTREEYPYSNGCVFGEHMRELPGRRFLPPAELPTMPMMYGISVAKPSTVDQG